MSSSRSYIIDLANDLNPSLTDVRIQRRGITINLAHYQPKISTSLCPLIFPGSRGLSLKNWNARNLNFLTTYTVNADCQVDVTPQPPPLASSIWLAHCSPMALCQRRCPRQQVQDIRHPSHSKSKKILILCHRRIGNKAMDRRRQAHPHNLELLRPCRNVGASLELATNVGGKRLNATGNNLVPIVLSIVTVCS